MPILEWGPGYRRFVEFDTSIAGVTHLLRSMMVINILDCEANPKLKRDLFDRCRATLKGIREGRPVFPPGSKVEAFQYEDEPIDRWCSFSVMAERNPKQTIRCDCDCFAPLWGAYFHLTGVRAGVAISQPKMRSCCSGRHCRKGRMCGHGMAHAYTLIDEGKGVEVFDGSVIGGMPEPPQSFYGSGEHAELWVR